MADDDWYYADGEQHKGPIKLAELSTLVRNGKLRPADLVWRDGMADWTPVDQIAEFDPGEPPRAVSGHEPPRTADGLEAPPWTLGQHGSAAQALRGRRSAWSTLLAQPIQVTHFYGQTLVLCGLVIVLAARGCDTVGSRGVNRILAKKQLSVSRFESFYEGKKLTLEDEQQRIREQEELTPIDDQRLVELDEKLQELAQEKSERESELQRGAWRKLDIAGREADASRLTWAYWREIAFILGTIALAIGLVSIGFSGRGPERWICLAMLAIILLSIYPDATSWLRRGDP